MCIRDRLYTAVLPKKKTYYFYIRFSLPYMHTIICPPEIALKKVPEKKAKIFDVYV